MTAYHPQANGSVEEFHRQLKASLSDASISQWTDAFSLVLLSTHNAVKADLGYSTELLIYGITLQLLVQFVDPSSSLNLDQNSYTSRFINAMRLAKPVSCRSQSTDVFVQPTLRLSIHVFVRRDSLHQPLETVYEGHFKVLHSKSKYYDSDKNGKNDNVSIDRLKATYLKGNHNYVDFPPEQLNDKSLIITVLSSIIDDYDESSLVSNICAKTTRLERKVKFQ